MNIHFFNEDIDFTSPLDPSKVTGWISQVITSEKRKRGALNLIYCSDDYLLKINREYLNHDYYTDVVTFNYGEGTIISGDLFLSVERIAENAEKFGVTFRDELLRVIIHGILHLMGYDDKTEQEKLEMTRKENKYLEQYIND